MSSSDWKNHDFEGKLIEIFESSDFDTKTLHHFGHPYVSAYQLAVAFQSHYPDTCTELNKVIGTDARTEKNTDNLARYIARELSSKIKHSQQTGDFFPFEAAWLSSTGLGELNFMYNNTENSGVPNNQYGGFSLYRLNSRYWIERDLYSAALVFIREKMLREAGLNPDWIDAYLEPDEKIGDLSLSELYEQLLAHAANSAYGRGDIRKVFGTSWGQSKDEHLRWKYVRQVLFDFDCQKIAETYKSPEDFFEAYRALQPHAELKGYSQQYCQTVIDAAKFLSREEFQDDQAFYHWVCETYEENPDKAPDEIAKNVKRIGYALSRDFLKERGYTRYIKPDGHVLDICGSLGLVIARDGGMATEVLIRAAELGRAPSPYALDKLLYLIGSGEFYLADHEDARKELDLGGRILIERKKRFARFVLSGEYRQTSPLDKDYFRDTTERYANADDACKSLSQ